MRFVADFHIHSKYSRATSQEMEVATLARWAKWKGIKVLGTGDFTHPVWFKELKENLKDRGNNGLWEYDGVYFLLTAEVCNIFFWGGKVRKIHNLIFAPSWEAAEEIARKLTEWGDVEVDGRPMLEMDAVRLVKVVRKVSPECMVIPAHIWTPWFSLFGSHSGFDSIEDCFGEETPYINALETGLSSDPPMNWRWSALDKYILISNSDAHSPANLGREANVLDCELNYREICQTIKGEKRDGFLFTIEFFPQEGKYHWDGHRRCNVRLSPKESRELKNICPRCGRALTIGVMHRVEKLGDREESFIPPGVIPCKHLIPLMEIIADALGMGKDTQSVHQEYFSIVNRWGGEMEILLNLSPEIIRESLDPRIGERILAVREEKVKLIPGYDGVYGEIKVMVEEEGKRQLTLF